MRSFWSFVRIPFITLFALTTLTACSAQSNSKRSATSAGREAAQEQTDDDSPETFRVDVQIVDAESGQPLPARLYLESDAGESYFFQSTSDEGSAFRYEKQNWVNPKSVEYHTTVSAHPAHTSLPAGRYTLEAYRGKSWLPAKREFEVTDRDLSLEPIELRRWIRMEDRHWYSGDLHLHRTLKELRNVSLAENLNAAFPLTSWVTKSDTPPSAGDKNLQIELPNELIEVDSQHVIWPRNTEYEIFSVGQQRHTLGALFVLGHQGSLAQTVPPWQGVIETARQSDPDVLFDMDKLAWPFAMLLPVIAPDATYELANNHLWRTEFAFREWYTPAPPFMQRPFGGTEGGERQWIDFTFGMYYTLLNAGFRLPPSAGTANGVHPVPAGFGRVYVHLPDGFDYHQWRKGLQQGRSFVTTGPMLFATADGKQPGEVFQWNENDDGTVTVSVEIHSPTPVSFAEIVIDGLPEHLLRIQQKQTPAGGWVGTVQQTIQPKRSGWFAVRVFEQREGERFRFAHSAPWYVQIGDQPVTPRKEERDYLVSRIQNEMQRSRGVVSEAAMQEYQQALDFYRSLPVRDATDEATNTRPLEKNRDRWLRNMIVAHRFTAQEIQAATGMSSQEAQQQIDRFRGVNELADSQLRILPYPGGRHPRIGFRDGAIDPQRDTKISVFPPWPDAGYAVVDLPEAVFSNLGLTYLAHSHIPTIWTERSVDLQPTEWKIARGGLQSLRKLPNGIVISSHASVAGDHVEMRMSLTNGTDQLLTGLRSQVCVMLKGLPEFNYRHSGRVIEEGPLIAIRSDGGDRWIITGFVPNQRTWSNPPVPCIHSDPIFADCPPGATVDVRGGIWFFEGLDIQSELKRLARENRWLSE